MNARQRSPLVPAAASRRDFLRILSTCAGLLGAATACAGAAVPTGPAIASTGDADLDELRRLAVDAPLDELLEHRLVFVFRLGEDYRTDPVLWRGFERLCDAAVDGAEVPDASIPDGSVPDRRLFARLLAQVIERGDPAFCAPLQPRIAELRRVP